MKKFTVKIPAKINLTLDIKGKKGKYHLLESLVTSINVFDTITVKRRKDLCINISTCGIPVGCSVEQNNAYLVAQAFKKKFCTTGVDIKIEKHIPVGGGLGGSSADIAGVIIAMSKIFNITEDLSTFASKFGSDSTYMMCGGYAIMSGRGEKIEFLPKTNNELYFLCVASNKSLSSRECFNAFDKEKNKKKSNNTQMAKEYFLKEDVENLINCFNNDLYQVAKNLVPEIEENFCCLSKIGKANMTGSGTVTYATFKEKKQRDKAYKKLEPIFGENLIKAQNIDGVKI